jgi:DNA mismatch repair ATPase MutL
VRKKAFKAHIEYSNILAMLQRYAIHFAGTAISCRKVNAKNYDLNTVSGASRLDTLRAIYGAPLALNLVPIGLIVD